MSGPAAHPQKDEILSRIAKGEKINVVAKAYGITRKTIYNWKRSGKPSATIPSETPREATRPEYDAAMKAAGEAEGDAKVDRPLTDEESKDVILDGMSSVNGVLVGLASLALKIPSDHPEVAKLAQLSNGEKVIYGELAPSVAKHLGLRAGDMGGKATWLFIGLALANEGKRFFELWRLAKSLKGPVSPVETPSRTHNFPTTDNPGFNGNTVT